MASKKSNIEIILSARDDNLTSSLRKSGQQVGSYQQQIAKLTAEVKSLGLMTEKSFLKQSMASLDAKPFSEIRAEMRRLTQTYVDLKTSGVASASELSKALENLRAKNKALAASMSAPSKLSSARSLLGVKSSAEIAAEVKQLQSAYLAIKTAGTSSMSDIAVASAALKAKTRELTGEQQKMNSTFLSGIAGKAGAALLGVLAVREIAGYANEVRKIADEYVNLNSRLKLVTADEQELATVRSRLYEISQETGTDFAGNADSYAKLARAVKDLGGDAEDTLQIVEMVNKSLTINGSTTAMSSAFMLQFAQAMGSGVLQGDEFRSMLENNGFFAAELAKALDTDIAGLRAMSKAGELTADVLRAAFPKMAGAINDEFAQISPTIGRAVTMLSNAFKQIIAESNESSKGTDKIAASITSIARSIEQNREGIIGLFSFIAEMAAGATDKVVRLAAGVNNIVQSGAGWDAVFSGDLSFFEFATMNSKELNEWLKKNKKSFEEVGAAGKESGEKVAGGAQASATVMRQATGKALEAMKKQYQDYANKIRDLQDQIADHQKSVAAQLREMSRSGMSDVSAWKDQKKEAEEYMAAAKQAAAAAQSAFSSGDTITGEAKFKEARQYADDARSAYAELNTEVKDGDRVMITSQQALKTSFDGVKQAGALGFEILTKQEAAAKSFMDELKNKSGFADLTEGMSEAEKKWLENWQTMSTYTLDKIKEIDLKLDEVANKKRTAKLVIDYEDGSRSVSSSSYSKGGRIGAYRNGGMIQQIQAMASGGGVRSILAGGRLPGFGGGDRRLLLGEDGEVMLRKESVKAGGLRAALAFNAGRFDIVLDELSKRTKANIGYRLGGLIDSLPQIPQRLTAGGPVAPSSTGELANFGTINLNLGNVVSAPMVTTRESARNLMRELTRMQQRSSR
jgi:tape measure domain-containing protein